MLKLNNGKTEVNLFGSQWLVGKIASRSTGGYGVTLRTDSHNWEVKNIYWQNVGKFNFHILTISGHKMADG